MDPAINICGHMFCKKCITTWSGPCPLCRSQVYEQFCCDSCAKPLKAILDELIVRCVACNSVMHRSSFHRHRQHKCSDVIQESQGQQPKIDINDATSSCHAAEFGCSFVGDNDSLEAHLLECPVYRVLPLLRRQANSLDEVQHRLRNTRMALDEYVRRTQQQIRAYNLQIGHLNDELYSVVPIGPGNIMAGPYPSMTSQGYSRYIAPLPIPAAPVIADDYVHDTSRPQPSRVSTRRCTIS